MSKTRRVNHIWYRNGITRRCLLCNKEQINIVKVVNQTGKFHGGSFKLHDDWQDV